MCIVSFVKVKALQSPNSNSASPVGSSAPRSEVYILKSDSQTVSGSVSVVEEGHSLSGSPPPVEKIHIGRLRFFHELEDLISNLP